MCDDTNSCTTNEACSGGVCTGVGDPLPQVVDDGVSVSRSAGVATITWTPAIDSAASAVLRGLVSGLPVRPGGADEVCLADGIVDGAATDAEDPNPGHAFWYLIQGTNNCGRGPYGSRTLNGVPTAPRVSSTSP